MVTPFVGVWIETYLVNVIRYGRSVTPFVGVWIETQPNVLWTFAQSVTPFVGVWIETVWIKSKEFKNK